MLHVCFVMVVIGRTREKEEEAEVVWGFFCKQCWIKRETRALPQHLSWRAETWKDDNADAVDNSLNSLREKIDNWDEQLKWSGTGACGRSNGYRAFCVKKQVQRDPYWSSMDLLSVFVRETWNPNATMSMLLATFKGFWINHRCVNVIPHHQIFLTLFYFLNLRKMRKKESPAALQECYSLQKIKYMRFM